AKRLGKLSLDKLQRVDAKAVWIVARNGKLIGEDQSVAHRVKLAISHIGYELLKRLKVAACLPTLAFAAKETVVLQLRRPNQAVGFALRDWDVLDDRKVGPSLTVSVSPLDWQNLRTTCCRGTQPFIAEDITGMVQHNVEDNV